MGTKKLLPQPTDFGLFWQLLGCIAGAHLHALHGKGVKMLDSWIHGLALVGRRKRCIELYRLRLNFACALDKLRHKGYQQLQSHSY